MQTASRIITIKGRQEAERARREAAIVAMGERMAGYGRANGGRFLLYGSAARGEMRHDSDVDILVDFPPDQQAAAWEFVEELSREFRVPLDIEDVEWCSGKFLAHIRAIPIR